MDGEAASGDSRFPGSRQAARDPRATFPRLRETRVLLARESQRAVLGAITSAPRAIVSKLHRRALRGPPSPAHVAHRGAGAGRGCSAVALGACRIDVPA